jgi:TetR/AcrR family transcriptional regulator of autoinduction and epiphytic fitness
VLTSTNPDRRTALKALHRTAILAAARALIDERGGPRFSVDELADRADVSRRTVFNHFASLDEIVLTLCDEALEVIIDDFIATVVALPAGDGSRSSMFDEISLSLTTTDIPGAVASMAGILGEPGSDETRERALSERAFTRAAGRLLDEVLRRNPTADVLDAELLVGSLMNGVIVVVGHWIREVGIRLDSTGRAAWQGLLGTLLSSVRSGYMPLS